MFIVMEWENSHDTEKCHTVHRSSHFRPHQTPKCRWILHFIMPHTKMKKMQSLNCCYYKSNTCAYLQKSLCSLQSACRREIEVGDWFEVDQQKLGAGEQRMGCSNSLLSPSFPYERFSTEVWYGWEQTHHTFVLYAFLSRVQLTLSMPFNWD